MVAIAAGPRERRAWEALADVPDPEIPVISVVDLGVIRSVAFEGERLTVEMLPTYVGCPAIEVMRQQIGERLRAEGLAREIEVRLTFAEPWTSDRISAAGRERLRASGFAPPEAVVSVSEGLDELTLLPVATCPYCGSRNTTLENPFGPTLCRAIYHCADCRQPFEQFKRI
ncbi:MAG: 1,2-phenylacetyl-CoA epoxidase subunit PaaD [Candidatus Limnocylindria bacterium]